MKALVCELCGGNELIKQDGFFVCQSCGTKYAPEEAKKLFVEINGTVKIDDTDEVNNLYELAHRAEESNIYEAGELYSKILLKRPNDWEAILGTLIVKSLKAPANTPNINATISEINNRIIQKHIRTQSDEKEQILIARKVANVVTFYLNKCHANAAKAYTYTAMTNAFKVGAAMDSFMDTILTIVDAYHNVGNYLNVIAVASGSIDKSFSQIIVNLWEQSAKLYCVVYTQLNKKTRDKYIDDIERPIMVYNPNYTRPQYTKNIYDEMLKRR